MDKNATPLDLSSMPLTPPPVAPEPVKSALSPAPPVSPKPEPAKPVNSEPQLSHDIHNGGPVAPAIPPQPPHAATLHRSAAPVVVAVIILMLATVGGLFLFLQQRQQKQAGQAPLVRLQPTPKPLFLRIQSPMGETSLINGELLVMGVTLPNTVVAVYSDTDDSSVLSDENGNFETTVSVEEGGGAVKVSAYSETGDDVSKTIEVGNQAVLGKSDARGQQKKDDGSEGSNGKSVGETPVSIQIRKPTAAPATADTTAAETKRQAKQKEQTDPTIFLSVKVKEQPRVKLGTIKFKELLSDQTGSASARVVKKVVEVKAASPAATLKRHGIMGVITEVSDGSLTVRHQNEKGKVTTILYNINTVIQSKSDKSASGAAFLVGQRINAVGYPSSEGLLATRIHIIPGNPVDVVSAFGVIPPSSATISPTGTSSAAPLTPSATIVPTLPSAPTVTPIASSASSSALTESGASPTIYQAP